MKSISGLLSWGWNDLILFIKDNFVSKFSTEDKLTREEKSRDVLMDYCQERVNKIWDYAIRGELTETLQIKNQHSLQTKGLPEWKVAAASLSLSLYTHIKRNVVFKVKFVSALRNKVFSWNETLFKSYILCDSNRMIINR